MRPSLRIALYSIVLAAPLLAACSNVGKDPKFAASANNTATKVVVTDDQVGGHEFRVVDEDGPYWIRTTVDGKVTAGISGQVYEKNGKWSTKDGNLCLEGTVWWKGGNCFQIYGGTTLKEAATAHPLIAPGPNSYYKFQLVK